ncbi:TetR/AcrR family transcriptional regulator [Phenylobacterium sp.]|uniref:TetR/AcrR family transcriptional regulator n=1 Tax=Phenylobacterium sp. TaxID=1871053 RepID=UPI0035AF0811
MSELAMEDRRVRRTKAALFDAFVHLVLDRRYDQIRVADIVERAGVGRSTFYEHYEGKDELLREGLAGPFAILADAVTEPHDEARLVEVIEHFWENRRIGAVLFNGPTARIITAALAEQIEARLSGQRLLAPAPLVAAQIAAGQMALLSAWLAGRASCPASVVARALAASARGGLEALEAG